MKVPRFALFLAACLMLSACNEQGEKYRGIPSKGTTLWVLNTQDGTVKFCAPNLDENTISFHSCTRTRGNLFD